jgi:hypothetical protein
MKILVKESLEFIKEKLSDIDLTFPVYFGYNHSSTPKVVSKISNIPDWLLCISSSLNKHNALDIIPNQVKIVKGGGGTYEKLLNMYEPEIGVLVIGRYPMIYTKNGKKFKSEYFNLKDDCVYRYNRSKHLSIFITFRKVRPSFIKNGVRTLPPFLLSMLYKKPPIKKAMRGLTMTKGGKTGYISVYKPRSPIEETMGDTIPIEETMGDTIPIEET